MWLIFVQSFGCLNIWQGSFEVLVLRVRNLRVAILSRMLILVINRLANHLLLLRIRGVRDCHIVYHLLRNLVSVIIMSQICRWNIIPHIFLLMITHI
jgi:hypothetical protein